MSIPMLFPLKVSTYHFIPYHSTIYLLYIFYIFTVYILIIIHLSNISLSLFHSFSHPLSFSSVSPFTLPTMPSNTNSLDSSTLYMLTFILLFMALIFSFRRMNRNTLTSPTNSNTNNISQSSSSSNSSESEYDHFNVNKPHFHHRDRRDRDRDDGAF
jgi:hypothetical protein